MRKSGTFWSGQRQNRYLLAASVGALLAAAQAAPAHADDAVEQVVVTGTLIPTGAAETISPVSSITSDFIRQQGTTRIEDLLNNLPQVYSSLSTSTQGSNIGDQGIATVNLRDLGSQRTLVLINGRRLMPGDPIVGQAADLNNIPSMLVDRVDVVTGGASATYGSDAVAGVVNFLMKKNFEGLRLDVQYSGYEHDNGNKGAQSALAATAAQSLNPSAFSAPTGSIMDGGTLDANAALGFNTPDDRGNITLYAGYRKTNPVTDSPRDYTKCQLTSGASFGCLLSGTTNPAEFQTITSTGAVSGSYALDPTTGNSFRTYNNARDGFSAENYDLQRPATRVIAGAFAHYQIAPHIEFYSELMGMDNHQNFLESPAGTYLANFSIACNNPMLSAQEQSVICSGMAPTATTQVKIAQRNVGGGPRTDDVRNTSYRLVAGLRGDLAPGWTYDVYAQSGTTLYNENLANSVSSLRIQSALNVVQSGSTLTCASQLNVTVSGCVPYDIFKVGGVTPQALKYIEVPAKQSGTTTEQVLNGTVTGDLTDYGIASPYADKGASLALGTQYRRESLSYLPDAEWQSGDLTGAGTRLPVHGSFDVYELYGEVSAPLVEHKALIEELSIDAGYRYSNYSSSGATDTYKFGGEWEPVDWLHLRGSYQRAVRAPSVVELFSGQSVALFTGTDPCDGAAPVDTAAQCANTGASAAQYGHIPPLNGQKPNSLTGGNPNLQPEKSVTRSFGASFTPDAVPGLSLTVDYFNIGISDVIGTISPSLALTQCATTGNSLYCSLIHRAPGSGALFSDPNGYVVSTTVNAGNMATSGIDFGAHYGFDLGDVGAPAWGSMTLGFNGTLLDKYVVEPIPGLGSYDCQGYYGPTCGTPLPTWRHQATTNWQTPWYGLSLGLTWRHIGGTQLEKTSSSPFLTGVVPATDAALPAYDYFDLTASAPLGDDIQVRVGVTNLFDRDPPLIGSSDISGTGAGNSYPGLYDIMGRYMFVSLSANL